MLYRLTTKKLPILTALGAKQEIMAFMTELRMKELNKVKSAIINLQKLTLLCINIINNIIQYSKINFTFKILELFQRNNLFIKLYIYDFNSSNCNMF